MTFGTYLFGVHNSKDYVDAQRLGMFATEHISTLQLSAHQNKFQKVAFCVFLCMYE